MTKAIFGLLIAAGAWFVCVSGAWGQETIAQGWLSYIYNGSKLVPSVNYADTLYAMVVSDDDCVVYCQQYGQWESILNIGGFWPDQIEFQLNQTGCPFIYVETVNRLYYRNGYGQISYSSCPGRLKIDNHNNIHVLWHGADDELYYGYSADTLHTFAVQDTFYSLSDSFYLLSSPNDSIICAVILNTANDSLYKYIGSNGEPIDFSLPYEIIRCDLTAFHVYDITIDYDANLYMVVAYPSDWWGDAYVWSENIGLNFLTLGGDYDMEGNNYELTFNHKNNEILISESTLRSICNIRRFYASGDRGNTWFRSTYDPPLQITLYGSTPREFDDWVDYFYFSDGSIYRTYYYPIPRDSIFNNLVSVDGDAAPIPDNILLSNYPNPFNALTTISFNLPQAGYVKLAIYDIFGRGIKRISGLYNTAGPKSLVWDGTNQIGESVSTGIYFCKLEIDGHYIPPRKMLLLK